MKIKVSLLFLTLLLACNNPRFILDTNDVSFKELFDNITNEQNNINTLEASCRISVDSEEFSGNFFAQVFYVDKDSLLISVKGPFGIHAGTLFIGENRFIFHNQIANKFYTGSIVDFQDKNFFQFPLNLSELRQIFVAKEKLPSMKISDYDVKDGKFYILANNGEIFYRIWIDHKSGHIQKVEGLVDEQVLFVREYLDLIKVNDIYFPKKISMTRPREKQAVALYYTNISLNKNINRNNFKITISDRAEQIDQSLYDQNL
jgi:outer membrane lipoprotein-sorting protein